MTRVGIRELRQDASAVIRRVEAGESIEVTVQGRSAARLVPLEEARHRVRTLRGSEIMRRAASAAADTTGWADEVRRLRDDSPLVDPWASDDPA